MTIAVEPFKQIYAGNGLSRQWNVPFDLAAVEDLKISIISPGGQETPVTQSYVLDTEQQVLTYPTTESGLDPLASGWQIKLVRQTPISQGIHFDLGSKVDSRVWENGLDKLTCISQELATEVARCVKYETAPSAGQDALTQAQWAAINSGADAAKVTQITTNQTAISGLQSSKLDVSAAASTYATQTALSNGLAEKQNTISDLADIRTGAAKGNTAVQPDDLTTALAAKHKICCNNYYHRFTGSYQFKLFNGFCAVYPKVRGRKFPHATNR